MRVRSTLDELKKAYGDDVRIVFKHYVVHPQVATTPALATCAAMKQGKFHEYEDLLWSKSWEGGRLGDLSEATMMKYAEELKLNADKFKADMAGDECKQVIDKDQKALAQVGVRGTPAFFINGRFINGAVPMEAFTKVIDDELGRKGLPVPPAPKPQAAATPTSD